MKRVSAFLPLIACTLLASAAHADGLGRLFSTPGERARIDDVRAGQSPAGVTAEAEVVDQLVLNGTLTGSNGKRMAWVNGAAIDPDAPGSDATVLYDGRVRLRPRGSDTPHTLKPGQGIDQATGEIYELYDRSPASIDRGEPTPATSAQVD